MIIYTFSVEDIKPQQFYNLLYNKFTTNAQKFATSQHLDMSRSWTLALRCGKFLYVGGEFVVQVVELLWACPLVVLYNMSVAGVRVVVGSLALMPPIARPHNNNGTLL